MRNIFSKAEQKPRETGWREQIGTKVHIAKKHYNRAQSLYRNRKRLGKAVYSVMYLFTNWKK